MLVFVLEDVCRLPSMPTGELIIAAKSHDVLHKQLLLRVLIARMSQMQHDLRMMLEAP